MGRCQCKNSFNNLKSNKIAPEPSGHTTGKPDHPNPEEAEENNIKYHFLKTIETLKEEKRNSLKEIEKKKKMEEINKCLKENQGKTNNK